MGAISLRFLEAMVAPFGVRPALFHIEMATHDGGGRGRMWELFIASRGFSIIDANMNYTLYQEILKEYIQTSVQHLKCKCS